MRAGPAAAGNNPASVRYPDVHYVYVLRSAKDGNLYTGYTSDLRARFATHTTGKAPSTRHRRPLPV